MRTLLLLALGLSACVTSSAPSGGGGALCTNDVPALPFVTPADGPGPDTFCDAVRDSLCLHFVNCGCMPTDDDALATCASTTAAQCAASFVSPEVRSALARGTLVWDHARAADFVARLATEAQGYDAITLDGSSVARGTVAVGATCVVLAGAFTECVDGASCSAAPEGGTRCAWDAALAPFQDEGQACVPSPGACGAARGLRCVARCDDASSPGVCEPGLAAGEACAAGEECESGACRGGACVALARNGAACAASADCESAACEDAECVAPPPPPLPAGAFVGSPCATQEDCATRSCVSGTCQTSACTARLDRGLGTARAVFTPRP